MSARARAATSAARTAASVAGAEAGGASARAPGLADVLLARRAAGDGTDVTFSVGSEGELIQAHRLVVERSPVLRRALGGGFREGTDGWFEVPDVSADHFRAFVHFLYKDQFFGGPETGLEADPASFGEDAWLTLAQLADRYDVAELKAAAFGRLGACLEWGRNVLRLLEVSCELELEGLEALCLDRIDCAAALPLKPGGWIVRPFELGGEVICDKCARHRGEDPRRQCLHPDYHAKRLDAEVAGLGAEITRTAAAATLHALAKIAGDIGDGWLEGEAERRRRSDAEGACGQVGLREDQAVLLCTVRTHLRRVARCLARGGAAVSGWAQKGAKRACGGESSAG